MADSFSWTTPISGKWSSANNWFDLTTGATAASVPGAADTATINGPDIGAIEVSGPASAVGLTVNNNVTLAGDFTLGSLTVANPPFSIIPTPPPTTTSVVTVTGDVVATTLTAGALNVEPGVYTEVLNSGVVENGAGAMRSTGSAGIVAGDLNVDGGVVRIDGVLNLGTVVPIPVPMRPISSGSLDIGNHASVQLGALTIADGSVSIDPTSSLEIGTAGTAAAGTITVDPGAVLFASSLLRSVGTVSISGPVLNNGDLVFLTTSPLSDVVNNGSLEFDGTTLSTSVNNGTISAYGGTLTAISGPGLITVSGSIDIGPGVGGTLDLQLTPTTVDFALGTGVPIDTGDTPLISGFANGDAIVLQGIIAGSIHYAPTGTGSGILSLDSTGTAVASLTLLGNYTSDQFALSADSSGSTVTLPCFVAGTRIQTRHGDVKVEHLRLGDDVATLSGCGFRPVRWLGHRTVRIAGHTRPHEVLPVRIAADAFGAGLPRRPVLLSPDHAVFADGVLIPIKYLLNGRTISQVTVRSVRYWHIELDAHDVVLAEGLPTESYLNTGDRSNFANGGIVETLHPSFASLIWEAQGCAPLCVTGPIVARIREQLRRRADEAVPFAQRAAAVGAVRRSVIR